MGFDSKNNLYVFHDHRWTVQRYCEKTEFVNWDAASKSYSMELRRPTHSSFNSDEYFISPLTFASSNEYYDWDAINNISFNYPVTYRWGLSLLNYTTIGFNDYISDNNFSSSHTTGNAYSLSNATAVSLSYCYDLNWNKSFGLYASYNINKSDLSLNKTSSPVDWKTGKDVENGNSTNIYFRTNIAQNSYWYLGYYRWWSEQPSIYYQDSIKYEESNYINMDDYMYMRFESYF